MFLTKYSPSTPQRIVSFVPSITELLYDLGLSNEVVGITRFCIHPQAWFQTKTRIGGTKDVNIEKIKALQPDLIIASKEENVQDQVNALAREFPVYLTDVCTYGDALQMIEDIATITSKQRKATLLTEDIISAFNSFTQILHPISAVYLIWKDPYMTVGGDTFINNMLQKIGVQNIFSIQQRYPQTTMQELAILSPPLVLLSSEPYPFKEKHIKEIKAFLPNAKVMLVDGEMFSWYGSRMKFMPAYFNKLIAEITT